MIDGAPLLSLSGIAKRFDNGTQAIARLDLDVADGEFVSLVGPSGCGKSTAPAHRRRAADAGERDGDVPARAAADRLRVSRSRR
ncbi:MAG: hypothetical protein WDN03_00560 [Rhizomicrobium sp.]